MMTEILKNAHLLYYLYYLYFLSNYIYIYITIYIYNVLYFLQFVLTNIKMV
jgi:hypothetical protein